MDGRGEPGLVRNESSASAEIVVQARDIGSITYAPTAETATAPDPDTERKTFARTPLYYPYIHFRSDTWVKCAILYWPKLARLAPEHYEIQNDSDVVEYLKGEGLIRTMTPRSAPEDLAQDFRDFVSQHEADLVARFGLDRGKLPDPSFIGPWEAPIAKVTRLGWVHIDKLNYKLARDLIDAGLAQWGRGGDLDWLGMHPQLASVYTCALVDRVASANGMGTVTDQKLEHACLNGWSCDTLGQVLLEQQTPKASVDQMRAAFVAWPSKSSSLRESNTFLHTRSSGPGTNCATSSMTSMISSTP